MKGTLSERNQLIGACSSLRASWSNETKLCDLQDADFTTGTPLQIAFESVGFVDSPRTVISARNWWELTLKEVQDEMLNEFDELNG